MIARQEPRRALNREPVHRKPTLAELLGPAMTIGIASVSAFGDFIVTVSDMMMSFNDDMPGGEIGTLEEMRIDSDWGFLFAGANEHVRRLATKARELVDKIQISRDERSIGDAVAHAYQETRTEIAVLKYLKAYGFATIEEFNVRGLGAFGSKIMSDFISKIDNFDLGIELLIYGFDEGLKPHFIEIVNPGIPLIHDPLLQWAIGAGAFMAMGVLNSREAFWYRSVEEIVYRLCEAKFSSESARGVGKTTAVAIWRPDHSLPNVLLDAETEKLRKIWLETRNYLVPEQAKSVVKEAFKREKNERQ